MPSSKGQASAGWAGIIQSISTPIGFFALVVLAIEAILGLIAFTASTQDKALIIRSMIILLFIVTLAVIILAFAKPAIFTPPRKQQSLPSKTDEDNTHKESYDIFLSSPMAAFPTDDAYSKERAGMLDLIDCLRTNCNYQRFYYAGLNLASQNDFTGDEALAAKNDFEAIEESTFFVLIYPAKLASGALVEAGYALALKKPCVYFVKDIDDLPYMLQHLHGIEGVEIYTYKTINDIKAIIKKTGCSLFHQSEIIN